ncbi:MAG: FAD-binding oxidoreductase [Gemmataceae bacterium]
MEASTCPSDDFGPLVEKEPSSVAEVGELVRQAAAEGQALYPLGGRTMLGLGLPPSQPGWGVDLRRLNGVIDYPARDMTITVQAGITLAALRDVLSREQQQLPIDVPQADRATLGGVLATNTSGPRRYGYGTLRDYVIGISTINDEGHEVKAGGRVVKNVAGYDLCKLHIGALGTLGIITQVTLKVKPLPEARALMTFGCETQALEDVLQHLHASPTRPVAVEVLNQAAARRLSEQSGQDVPDSPWLVAVLFEEKQATVAWQIQQLEQELPRERIHVLTTRHAEAALALVGPLVELTAEADAGVTFKANVLPRAVAEFCRQADDLPDALLLQAHAGNGIVRGHARGELTQERAATWLHALRTAAGAAAGNLIVLRCPSAWKKTLPVWGEPRGDAWLMREIKKQLDPRGLFNAGRFIDGI